MVKAYSRTFDSKSWTEYKGLSNDPRPLNAKKGDVFIETDTLDVYLFMGDSWKPIYQYVPIIGQSLTTSIETELPGVVVGPGPIQQ